MTRGKRRWQAGWATLIVTVGLLVGCGGSEPGAEPAPGAETAAATPGGEATPTEPPAPSESASASAEATVAPATGLRVRSKYTEVRAPKGWTRDKRRVLPAMQGLTSVDGSQHMTFLVLQAPTGDIRDRKELLAHARTYFDDVKVKGAPPPVHKVIDLDGWPGYYAHGWEDDVTWEASFGGSYRGERINVRVYFMNKIPPPAERQRIVDSVIASLRWR